MVRDNILRETQFIRCKKWNEIRLLWEGMNVYINVEEPFNTEYKKYVIAFCPDIDLFFVTNQRHFYYEYEKEFDNKDLALKYFQENLDEFVEIHTDIMSNCIYKYKPTKDLHIECN